MRIIANTRLLALFINLLWAATMIRGADAQSPKLRVAYTAFAGTFTVLWLGKDSGLYQKYGADMELLYIGS
ncbi:MAG TPA: hypothetical protein VNT76_14915, partial [Candidatus Binatus sp.]|nr:hypothetical protein [Candidatus Binatus sp.]